MTEIHIKSATDYIGKLEYDGEIEIIRQVMDFFDLSARAVDVTKQIEVLRTSNNKKILEGIGFSNSKFQYKKNYADIYSNSILVMENALVQVRETTKTKYKINFVSESKEIWKLISNDTLGDLDLSDTSETKTAALIKQQWEAGITPTTKYHYIFADYGGKLPESNTVFANWQIPSYRVSYLKGKIENKYNVQLPFSPGIDFDAFITFSDANEIENTNDKIVFEREYQSPIPTGDVEKFKIEEDGRYYLIIEGIFLKNNFFSNNEVKVRFGQQTYTFTESGVAQTINLVTPEFDLLKYASFEILSSQKKFLGKIQIIRKAINVSGNASFKTFKIASFLKEIIYQTASIVIKRPGENIHDFISLEEILTAPALDWSQYYNDSDGEEYSISKYAQNNWLRYKYEDKEDSNKDGIITVSNENIELNKDLIKSEMYNTPVNSVKGLIGGYAFEVQQYQLWKRTAEQKNGSFEERYQPVSGRMFFVKGNSVTTPSNFNISATTATVTTNKITIANNEDFNFQKVVNKNYRYHSMILSQSKLIKASLKLPLLVFASFDFKRRIYISQLGGYFIVNRLVYKSNELMDVELISANIWPIAEPTTPTPLHSVFFSATGTDQHLVFLSQADIGIDEDLMIIGDISTAVIKVYVNDLEYSHALNGNTITVFIDYHQGVNIIKVSIDGVFINQLELTMKKTQH